MTNQKALTKALSDIQTMNRKRDNVLDMDNTEKLLRAFIKAQGYEIEETLTGEFKTYSESVGMHPDPIIDYKVTKKPISNQLPKSAKSISFGPSVLK